MHILYKKTNYEYLGYKFYNVMHTLDIRLNELTKIKCYELIIDFNIWGYKITL